MKRKRQKASAQSPNGCGWLLIFLLGVVVFEDVRDFLFRTSSLRTILIIGVVAVVVILVFSRLQSKRKTLQHLQAVKVADIDNMNGHNFEHYVANLLTHQGFRAQVTPGSGDFGVDIVASKDNFKYAIQVKRHNQKISRRAISDAVAGKQHYHCEKAMVVTNSYFTHDAIELARSTSCDLVDRDALMRWILDFQKVHPNQRDIYDG